MAIERHEFYTSARGALAEDEDWFTLVLDPANGSQVVQHEWSYTDPYGRQKAQTGISVFTVAEFQDSSAPDEAKEALAALLNLLG